MTSEDYIEELRSNGVKLLKGDNSLIDMPPNFLEQATEFCQALKCSSISYTIIDPQDSEHTELRVLDCGYAE